ncbi:hypothetical protein C8Q70DRAFT_640329 [Cubamyces menziesii]|nr:hypothetical protein C8Q70DRAFT_640329 [Cubamyces menziesii]
MCHLVGAASLYGISPTLSSLLYHLPWTLYPTPYVCTRVLYPLLYPKFTLLRRRELRCALEVCDTTNDEYAGTTQSLRLKGNLVVAAS